MRSFGTEDRPTDRPAPPREEIYEYIIFRGSDIKDITVCEPPKAQHALPQDPAIVQVSECWLLSGCAFTGEAGFHVKGRVSCLSGAFSLRNCPPVNSGLLFL